LLKKEAAHDAQFTRLEDGQRRQQTWQEGANVFNFIRRRSQHDYGHRQRGEILLARQIAVHGDNGVKLTTNQREQFAV